MTDDGVSYTCELCGDTFATTWTVAEADTEALELFGVQGASAKLGPGAHDMAVVCEECFLRMRGGERL